MMKEPKFMIKSNKYAIIIFIVILFALGFCLTFFRTTPRVKLGDQLIPCNPKAKINLKRKYLLRLWDYDLPLGDDRKSYRDYLHKAVVAFQKQYPNIKVEITLLDLFNGPGELAQAIRTDTAPDVYCSAFRIPEFNYKKQIPVGFFLKKDDLDAYIPNILALTRISGVPCYFPRWTAPLVWIGNKTLLDKAGLPVAKIQARGWEWGQLTGFYKNIPAGNYLLVGSLAYNGVFPQFAPHDNGRARIASDGLDLLETLITKKLAPADIEQNSLGRFISGQSLFLAGVRPVMYSFIKMKLSELKSDWEPVILPAPYWRQQNNYGAENGVICVYRNKESAGDSHIAAAVKLGQFLSDYAVITPWKQMMVLPASQKAADRFRKESIPGLGEQSILDYFPGKIRLANIEDNLYYQEKVYPVLQDFCNGKISKEIAKAKILGE